MRREWYRAGVLSLTADRLSSRELVVQRKLEDLMSAGESAHIIGRPTGEGTLSGGISITLPDFEGDMTTILGRLAPTAGANAGAATTIQNNILGPTTVPTTGQPGRRPTPPPPEFHVPALSALMLRGLGGTMTPSPPLGASSSSEGRIRHLGVDDALQSYATRLRLSDVSATDDTPTGRDSGGFMRRLGGYDFDHDDGIADGGDDDDDDEEEDNDDDLS